MKHLVDIDPKILNQFVNVLQDWAVALTYRQKKA